MQHVRSERTLQSRYNTQHPQHADRENDRWDTEVKMTLLDDFVAIATSEMSQEQHPGEWEEVRTGISVYERS